MVESNGEQAGTEGVSGGELRRTAGGDNRLAEGRKTVSSRGEGKTAIVGKCGKCKNGVKPP